MWEVESKRAAACVCVCVCERTRGEGECIQEGMGWLCRKLLILGLGTFPGTGSDVLVGVLLLCVPPTSAIRLSAVHRLQAARRCKTWQNKVLEPWGELWSIGIPGQRARKKVDLSQLKKQMFFFFLCI